MKPNTHAPFITPSGNPLVKFRRHAIANPDVLVAVIDRMRISHFIEFRR